MPTDSLDATAQRDVAARRRELSEEFKRRAREQWTGNPCGADVARHLEFGTREYFDQIENYRYNVHGRWMKADLPFSSYRGKRLLEIGCGTGTDLLQFARNGANVTGVDLTPRSIEIARKRFEVYGLPGQFVLADAENLAFPDESFDAVYSFGVLHHTPDTERAIGEVHRVLKPGCTATIMLYNKSSFLYWGPIILKRGLLRGELFKMSAEEIMSRDAEYCETGGRPLVKAYSPSRTRRMFAHFAGCDIKVRQLNRTDMGGAGRLFSDGAIDWLERKFGWNLIITATKSAQRT